MLSSGHPFAYVQERSDAFGSDNEIYLLRYFVWLRNPLDGTHDAISN